MSVYRVTDIIGTSSQSWEEAASAAVKAASQVIRGLRVAEVVAQDVVSDDQAALEAWLREQVPAGIQLVLTTGGTGVTPDDANVPKAPRPLA